MDEQAMEAYSLQGHFVKGYAENRSKQAPDPSRQRARQGVEAEVW